MFRGVESGEILDDNIRNRKSGSMPVRQRYRKDGEKKSTASDEETLANGTLLAFYGFRQPLVGNNFFVQFSATRPRHPFSLTSF